ncbi:MAG: hypothetical protein MAG453_00785 [Calditrichaeota bacterium]|nr:hypothetical protein [Calditrichota bacterium]
MMRAVVTVAVLLTAGCIAMQPLERRTPPSGLTNEWTVGPERGQPHGRSQDTARTEGAIAAADKIGTLSPEPAAVAFSAADSAREPAEPEREREQPREPERDPDEIELPPAMLPQPPTALAPVPLDGSDSGPSPARVEARVLATPDAEPGPWRVQVIAVSEQRAAERVEQSLRSKGASAVVIHWQGGLYKVMAGSFASRERADSFAGRLHLNGYPDAFVVNLGAPAAGSAAEPVNGFQVQVLSLADSVQAVEAAREAEQATGYSAAVVPVSGAYAVRLGVFATRKQAAEVKNAIAFVGYEGAFIVRSRK